jgi:hypothetical protein
MLSFITLSVIMLSALAPDEVLVSAQNCDETGRIQTLNLGITG